MHKIYEMEEDTICLVTHGTIISMIGIYISECPVSKFWTFASYPCGI